MPIFVRPEGLGMFLWPLMQGVNGRNVAKGDSPLKDRLGDRVLDSSITIIDDPHLDYDNGASPIDENGIPTRVNTVFKDGVLKMFLYDLDTAGLAGTEPTGNNGCSPYSLTVVPGSKKSDELLASLEDGLYVKGLVGFGQSNIMNGDFSCNVNLGYRVKNGKLVGRVKDTMIAGNIYKMFESGVQLSSDIDPIQRAPFAVIPGVHVSTK
jgi:PmbA protein